MFETILFVLCAIPLIIVGPLYLLLSSTVWPRDKHTKQLIKHHEVIQTVSWAFMPFLGTLSLIFIFVDLWDAYQEHWDRTDPSRVAKRLFEKELKEAAQMKAAEEARALEAVEKELFDTSVANHLAQLRIDHLNSPVKQLEVPNTNSISFGTSVAVPAMRNK